MFTYDFADGSATGQLSLISKPSGAEANQAAGMASVSSDGVWIVFESYASNLVAGSPTGKVHIYALNRTTSQLILVGNGDAFGPVIGGPSHGDYRIAYWSNPQSGSPVQIVVSTITKTSALAKTTSTVTGDSPALSQDGTCLAYY